MHTDDKAPGGCLLCGKPLRYFPESREMTCALCGGVFRSSAACEAMHYICDSCHANGSTALILERCAASAGRNPIELAAQIMRSPSIHMHGNEHHVLVGAVLLTAYHNCGGELDRPAALAEMARRGGAYPGGACGLWGCCGAAVSAGMFVSIARGVSPLSGEPWSLANQMTAEALSAIAAHGGPRCCKRDSFAAITAAARFSAEHFGIVMELPAKIRCTFSGQNRECLGSACPYSG